MTQKILSSSLNPGQAGELFHFTQGVEFDQKLFPQELRVQKSWVRYLSQAGYLSAEEGKQILSHLEEAFVLMTRGTFPWREEDEDIHMNLERFVTERGGELGRKMHLGRSRNDLIATTLRLHVAAAAETFFKDLTRLVETLLWLAENQSDLLVPGLTHLQHGQPIRMGQIWTAHALAFLRDKRLYEQTYAQALESLPLGSGAFSGTSLQLPFAEMAKDLSFARPTLNGYDSVGDRDFILALLNAHAQCATHLARISEDILYFSSTPVSLLILSPQWSTGSSMMPNKRNADVCELIRARASRLIAAHAEGLGIVKSTPTSYGSDFHELKKTLLRSGEELGPMLSTLTPFLQGLSANAPRARELLNQGHILATDLADLLVSRGKSFREAYQTVAGWIALADKKGVQVHELPLQELMPDLKETVSFEAAVERKAGPGGTARRPFRESLSAIQEKNKRPFTPPREE